jgi:hypothetical protein
MTGWMRKFEEKKVELAHKWNGDKTACGLEIEKAQYLEISIKTFPEHKVCPECVKKE